MSASRKDLQRSTPFHRRSCLNIDNTLPLLKVIFSTSCVPPRSKLSLHYEDTAKARLSKPRSG